MSIYPVKLRHNKNQFTLSSYTKYITETQLYQPSRFSLKIFLCLLVVWTAAQPLSILGAISDSVRGPLFYIKNWAGALVIIWMIFNILLGKVKQPYLHLIFNKKLLFLALLFPLYVTLHNLYFFTINTQEVGMYWLWVLAGYSLFPIFLQDERDQKAALYVVLYVNLLILIIGIILGLRENTIYWNSYSSRMAFGFLNPIYYSYSWQVCLPIALQLISQNQSKRQKLLAFCLMFCALCFMYLAVSRGALLFSITLLAIYLLVTAKWKIMLKVAFLCAILSLVPFLVSRIELDNISIAAISSGRSEIWQSTIDYYLSSNSISQYIWGIGSFDPIGYKQDTLDPLSLDFRLGRRQIDNTYLSIFLQFGLLGIISFFMPLLIIITNTAKLMISTKSMVSIYVIAFGCWLGLLLQMSTITLIPSVGNAVNIFIFVFLMPNIMKLKVEGFKNY